MVRTRGPDGWGGMEKEGRMDLVTAWIIEYAEVFLRWRQENQVWEVEVASGRRIHATCFIRK